jgi:hypothetical protein
MCKVLGEDLSENLIATNFWETATFFSEAIWNFTYT